MSISVANKLKLNCGHDGISWKLLKLGVPKTDETSESNTRNQIIKLIFTNNYRPISLLPAFSELIEKQMYNKISSFFTALL